MLRPSLCLCYLRTVGTLCFAPVTGRYFTYRDRRA